MGLKEVVERGDVLKLLTPNKGAKNKPNPSVFKFGRSSSTESAKLLLVVKVPSACRTPNTKSSESMSIVDRPMTLFSKSVSPTACARATRTAYESLLVSLTKAVKAPRVEMSDASCASEWMDDIQATSTSKAAKNSMITNDTAVNTIMEPCRG